ncbi:hypothetical protein BTR25_12160 [Bacillus sp. MRMR6]|nr:hypothetical protein BTR25_12160 [Bacillus sp. MRMR6]
MKSITKFFSRNKTTKIDVCEKNLDRFLTDELASDYSAFLNKKNIQFKEYDCQSKCKECQQSPYAIVNGKFIAAETSGALLEKLKNLE